MARYEVHGMSHAGCGLLAGNQEFKKSRIQVSEISEDNAKARRRGDAKKSSRRDPVQRIPRFLISSWSFPQFSNAWAWPRLVGQESGGESCGTGGAEVVASQVNRFCIRGEMHDAIEIRAVHEAKNVA